MAKAEEHLKERSDMLQKIADLEERIGNEKNLRLEQVNQKELDRIKETE